jgi:hypothetical protein
METGFEQDCVVGLAGIPSRRDFNRLQWLTPVSASIETKELSGTLANLRPKPPPPKRRTPAGSAETSGGDSKGRLAATASQPLTYPALRPQAVFVSRDALTPTAKR